MSLIRPILATTLLLVAPMALVAQVPSRSAGPHPSPIAGLPATGAPGIVSPAPASGARSTTDALSDGVSTPVVGACPTFSWTHVATAPGYELVVLDAETRSDDSAPPVLRRRLPAGASSWTPARSDCLGPGIYAWSVRVLTEESEVAASLGEWSLPTLFRVAASSEAADPETPTSRVRFGAAEAQSRRPPPVANSVASRRSSPHGAGLRTGSSGSTTAGRSAQLRARDEQTTGDGAGVIGTVSSIDGSGLIGENLAGGADLELSAVEPALLDEDELARASSSPVAFDFHNPGAGTMTLRVDGVDVVTTATDQDTTYTAGTGLDLVGTQFRVDTSEIQRRVNGSCSSGSSIRSISSTGSVICEPDTDTDTNTTYSAGDHLMLSGTTFHVADGSGSGLDADLLDGLDSAALVGQAATAPGAVEITSLPFTISSPGVYYMGQNLETTSDGVGIFANDVVVDLNGYTISGPTSGAFNYGVLVFGERILVRNGTITGFPSSSGGGVTAVGAFADVTLERLQVIGTGGNGISLTYAGGIRARVVECTAIGNANWGITVENGIVERSTTSGNGSGIGNGISVSSGIARENHIVSSAADFALEVSNGVAVGNVIDGGVGGLSAYNSLVEGNFLNGLSGTSLEATGGSNVVRNTIASGGGSPAVSVSSDSQLRANQIACAPAVNCNTDTAIELSTSGGALIEANFVSDFDLGIDFADFAGLWVSNRFQDVSMAADNVTNATDGGGNLSY